METRDTKLAGRLNRRDLLKRGLALGLSLPAIGGLLAACGGNDEDATATTAAPTAGASGGSPTTAAATSTTAAAAPTTAASATPGTSPTTGGEASPSAEGSPAGGTGRVEGGDPLMGKTIEPAASEGGTMIEASNVDLRSLNPLLWNDNPSFSFGAFIFEALIDTNPDTLEPVGNLVEAWESSADGLAMTLYLRDGVTWHDGEAFTAQDVKTTFDLFMNPDAGGSQTSDFVAKIKNVAIVDDMTVQCDLNFVNPDFLIGVGNSTIVIADHIWSGVDAASIAQDSGSTGQDPSRVVGTGPFIFKEWITNDHATASRNDSYWGGKPHLDEYIYKIVPDSTAQIQQLRTGEVDYVQQVSPSQVQDLEGGDVQVVDYPTLSFTYYGYNLDETKTTKFQDPNVRKALFYAIDRQALVDNIYNGYAEVAVGTMPTLSWAYAPDLLKEKYEYDVDKAKSLLDAAGWVDSDGDGIREKDGEKFSINMWTLASSDTFVNLTQAIQQFWNLIGVEMTPQTEPFQAFVDRITQTFDFDTFLVSFGWNATPDQSSMWGCDGYKNGFNSFKYCNPKLDETMHAAVTETDKQKRIQLYADAQNMWAEDLPAGVMMFAKGISGYAKRVHNLFPSVGARFNTETWWIEQ